MKNLRTLATTTLMLFVFLPPMMSRAGIVLDYSGDTFFANNPTAKAALEAAAADVNAAIDFSCLGVVTDDVITGTNGGSSVDFTFSKTYINPADGVTTQVPSTQIVAGQINVFAGARTFGGNTLGEGSAGGTGLGLGITDASDGSLAGAYANAEALEQHSRGGGPIVLSASGSFGGNSFAFNQGLHTGSIAFDDDSNWHFDHTTAVAAGLNDFYSVALHELLHVVGFGTSASWQSLISGTDYLGAEGIAANGGTGVGLADSSGHFAMGVMSPRISDGVLQEVAMDADITVGTRKYLTELDLAVMRDLGLKTVVASAVPEPSSLAFLALCGAAFCGRRRGLVT